MTLNRRHFLHLFSAAAGATVLGIADRAFAQDSEDSGSFELPPLPYAYNALEPYIDAETMRFHHDKHHAAYIKKLNAAISKYPELKNQSAEDLISNLNSLPEDILKTVRNNGGGHVNHTMFWSIMAANAGGEPTGAIAEAINKTFGSFAEFQQQFNAAGINQFGSGWTWLAMDKSGVLKVLGTPNQDSPLMQGMYPIMGNDVWEHAYYLKYKNKRDEYLKQWWNVVNWDAVNQRFEQAITSSKL